jgi:ankyrin repeat protein
MKRTALHEAVLSNKINNVELLIKFHADPNIQDIDGNTAAHYAADLSY